ncbi:carboxylate-amine ligase [Rhodoplanes roseus]|uniref:Putative glutamate--cysteine ligase 2 n=1 Tax=Rhodoplanes roseus TaxID=29409 RepID=A0A327L5S5_9BRAD|nr:carboxylate-amine ligase [Rhodoplanes roseus]RAI45727.1 carboxylate-amine ligase [Rhodoplanes roseus]
MTKFLIAPKLRRQAKPRRALRPLAGTPIATATNGFTVGLEEELFLADAHTFAAPSHVPEAFFARVAEATGDRAKPEFLQAQVELVSGIHCDLQEARREMAELRETVSEVAAEHGLVIIAAGTHPTADWRRAEQTDAPRYDQVMDQLQMIGRRDMMSGLHVHVALPDPGRRVEVMARMVPYVPLFLALSTSSPFWSGIRTGLKGYRLAAYSELPRTGLPMPFADETEYRTYVDAMTRAGAIPNATYLWWTLRPSESHPTLELRAPDSCTRLDDAIAIAALYRVLARRLYTCAPRADVTPTLASAFAAENMWRAQRYGVQTSFVTVDGAEPVGAFLERVLHETAEDAEILGCRDEVELCRTIVTEGTSADAQLATYERHAETGGHRDALRAVARFLAEETRNGHRADIDSLPAVASGSIRPHTSVPGRDWS